VVAAAVLLSACTAQPIPTADTGYTPTYETVDCPTNIEGVPSLDFPPEVECGYLTVPENRAKPDGTQIKVFVMRLPAVSANPAPDPLFMLAGGPGGGGSFQAASFIASGLNADRDVILTDQRGTHLAQPLLGCAEYDQALNADASIPFLSDEAIQNDVDATKVCVDRMTAEGYDVASYNSTENAQDIADLRVAMGIDEWNLYGVSYGSRLALTILRDHPEGLKSVVLDSVSPPNVNIAEDWWAAPAGSFKQTFADCAAETACAAAFPDLEAEFYSTLDRLVDAPVVVESTGLDGKPLTVNIDPFAYLFALIMQSEHFDSSRIPLMIHQFANGDPSLIVTATVNLMTPESFMGLGGLGLAFTVFCSESAGITTREAYLERSEQSWPEVPSVVFGAQPKQARLFDQCPVWDVPAADPHQSEAVVSDVPVLILEGEADAATAPAWLDELGGLAASKRVDFPRTGHGVLDKHQCARDIMAAFLADPAAEVDSSCVAAIEIPFLVQ
jgi:pimeloyl-ACP methyl ester carboxylesterase